MDIHEKKWYVKSSGCLGIGYDFFIFGSMASILSADVSKKKWIRPTDVIKDYNKATTIKNDRVIFKINENDYRLIAEVNYQRGGFL